MIASWQRVFTDQHNFYRKDLSKSMHVPFLIKLITDQETILIQGRGLTSLSLDIGIKLASTSTQQTNWACPTPLSQVTRETVTNKAVRMTKFNQKEKSPQIQHSYSKLIFISWILSNVHFVSVNWKSSLFHLNHVEVAIDEKER